MVNPETSTTLDINDIGQINVRENRRGNRVTLETLDSRHKMKTKNTKKRNINNQKT